MSVFKRGLNALRGGDTGQVLTKLSPGDGDFGWGDASGGASLDLSFYWASFGQGYAAEYNGSPVTIGAAAQQVPFDTVYLGVNGDASPSAPLVDGVAAFNDYVHVLRDASSPPQTHITIKKYGLWLVSYSFSLDAPLTVNAKVQLRSGFFWLPAGASEFFVNDVAVFSNVTGTPDDPELYFRLYEDAADSGISFTYGSVGMVPLILAA